MKDHYVAKDFNAAASSYGHSLKPYSLILQPLLAAVASFIILSIPLLKKQCFLFGSETSQNVFVHLASSFLHGRLDLDLHSGLDLSPFGGKLYAMWPPLCAFFLMPFVYIHGLCIGDNWISIFLVSVSIFYGWLIIDLIGQRAKWHISLWYKTLLTLFLSCGTSFLFLSLGASPNYMVQVAAATMMFISLFHLLSANNKPQQYLVAGVFWALAICSRIHLILAAPVFLYVSLFGLTFHADIKIPKQEWKEKVKILLCLLSPIVCIFIFLAWYNWARFGSILECGISYHLMDPRFLSDFKRYGYINPHYFWRNAYYTLIRVPYLSHLFPSIETKPHNDWMEGYSIFFQSPPLLYALNTFKSIKEDNLIAALWMSVIPITVVILCLMGTGWVQFGARYLFDTVPLLFPLVIIGSKGKATSLFVVLVTGALAATLFGLSLASQWITIF